MKLSEAAAARLLFAAIVDLEGDEPGSLPDTRAALERLTRGIDERADALDWLATQIEGCRDYADRLPGQGPADYLTLCLRRDLEDALRVARSEEAGGTTSTAERSSPDPASLRGPP